MVCPPLPNSKAINSQQAMVFRVGHLGTQYWDWVERPEPGQPRFFDNSLLEACSKTPWWLVPLLWVPLFSTCMYLAQQAHQISWPGLATYLVLGVLAWQLLEYVIHRFVFHASMTSYWGITLHFLFHGCHHKYPSDLLRLVFPPVPASLLVAAVYVALHSLLPSCHALPLFGGMGLGYVAYDVLHYLVHCTASKRLPGVLQQLRRRHLEHHFRDHSRGYGISSPMYDVLFMTRSVRL
ncbi:hypothetical protein V8C86DRAFT_50544 [Haematococcus lacustris]|nr:hypothetical protein QJQ45_007100 [Haematococcus lacustris]